MKPAVIRAGILAVAVIAALAPVPSAVVERTYSSAVYPALQHQLTGFSNLWAVALFDVLLLGTVIGLPLWWGLRLRRAPPERRRRTLGRLAVDTLVVAACFYLAFLATWGLNYRREPLNRRVDFDQQRVSHDRLIALAERSARELNRLYPERATVEPSMGEVAIALAPAFDRAQRMLASSRPAIPARPKRSLLQPYFVWSAIDGMANPFFLETLVNHQVLPAERPALLAHEWAHLAGYAEESEASFVGWITCLWGDGYAQYSGWLYLYREVMAQLPPVERRRLQGMLEPGPLADRQAIARRFERSSPAVTRAARTAYDGFLKANRVEAGIHSYDGVVALILGTTFDDKWKLQSSPVP
jgi:hypothetical protein